MIISNLQSYYKNFNYQVSRRAFSKPMCSVILVGVWMLFQMPDTLDGEY